MYPIRNRKLAKPLSLTTMINLLGRKPKNEKFSPISMFIIALYHILLMLYKLGNIARVMPQAKMASNLLSHKSGEVSKLSDAYYN